MKLEGLNTALFHAGERVCCAVSGGADSVALLLALQEANAARESLGIVLSAVHVHHGLRGMEADEDQAFVGDLCSHLGVPLMVEALDTVARQAAEREGVEEAARNLRYGVFGQLFAAGKADAIATAHTLDDQAETVMLKLIRGAWTEGLGGISTVRFLEGSRGKGVSPSAPGPSEQPKRKSEPILRPMLNVRRKEVERFLSERNQSWREDSSNRNLDFNRNRVRHELMPLLRSFNPGIDEVLARTAVIAGDEERYWTTEIARLLPSMLLPGKPVRGGGRAVSTAVGEHALAIELERLKALAPAVRRRILREATASLGCRIGADETAKLLALAGLELYPGLTGKIGSRLEFAGGLRADRSARELRLSRVSNLIPPKM
ncbi:MAG: tRNA lysidine(34) synthetase TilS [Janthinobacterium lividum]